MNDNSLQNITVGFALTGSFCVFDKVIPQLKSLVELGVSVLPIFSETVYNTTTRFYDRHDLIKDVESMTGRHQYTQ